MDVSPTAVNHYRDLLAGSFMIRVLPPWFENPGKAARQSAEGLPARQRRAPLLLGLEHPDQLPLHPRYGASWEGFALAMVRHFRRLAGYLGKQDLRGKVKADRSWFRTRLS